MGVREDIWLALHDAIGWQMGLVNAHGRKTVEGMEAMDQAKRYRAILRRRYGTDKTKLDAMMEHSKLVSAFDLKPER